jgi:hypothetical protein
MLLKLYIYGYLNRVQSSRRLEREAGHNVKLMWLTCRLVPDHKTISDFRKDNGSAIKRVCAQFIELCRQMGLLAIERRDRWEQVQGRKYPCHRQARGGLLATANCHVHRPAPLLCSDCS